MKKGLFPFVVSVLILLAVLASGCLAPLTGESNNTSAAEDMAGILEIYELNVFVPILNGQERVVSSGTYSPIPDTSETRVIRLVNDEAEMALLGDAGLLALDAPEWTDIYFITAENFTLTPEGVNRLIQNPVMTNITYSIQNPTRSPTMIFEENFTGVVVYTFRPNWGGTSLAVNDGAEAIQIILPEGTTTGNRIIGTASPRPDLTEEDEAGRNVLKWNAPLGAVSVRYYSENAPLYLLISFSALIGVIVAVFLWYRYQINKLHRITELTDDESTGFRKLK